MSLAVLDLFSGIGGFSLGLERAGMRSVALCESDPFARAVLRRHWPSVPCYPDIAALSACRLERDGVERVGLVCGGFPCQDVSAAGRGGGLAGERSGLWFEMLRLVAECRPDWVVVENSPVLRVRGADAVLGGLAAAGYACWPFVVGAWHAGAPHRRQRAFIVAHAEGTGLEDRLGGANPATPGAWPERRRGWAAEPALGRVVDGLPAELDRSGRGPSRPPVAHPGERRARLSCLGNAVVPEVAAVIGAAILSAEAGAAQAAAERTRSAKVLRNLATLGATTARQYPA